MPILIGTNSALPSRTTKTPSVSLRVWPGFELGGRRRAASAAAGALVGLRLLHDLPVRVVDQLAHGDGRNRHRDDVLARRGRDVGRAGEAGPHVGNLLVDR